MGLGWTEAQAPIWDLVFELLGCDFGILIVFALGCLAANMTPSTHVLVFEGVFLCPFWCLHLGPLGDANPECIVPVFLSGELPLGLGWTEAHAPIWL